MRNTIIILFIGFTSFYGNSQSIISLEQYASYHDCDYDGCEPPEDLEYIADLNNSLNRYVGTWEGIEGTKKVTFKIEKTTLTDSFGVRNDALLIKYKILDTSTNQLTVSTYDLVDDNEYVIEGWNYIEDKYYAHYLGFDDCGQYGWAILDHNFSLLNGEEFKIRFLVIGEVYDQPQCTNGVIPSPIPNNIPLTRI